MNRYRAAGLLLGFAALALTPTDWISAADRPHIVMAFADDWGKYASAYARLKPGGISDLVSTPHFNQFSQVAMAAPDHQQAKSQLLDEVRQNIRSFCTTSNRTLTA